MHPTALRSCVAAFAVVVVATTAVAAIPSDRKLAFQVSREGEPLGTHTLSFREEGDRLIVDIAIKLVAQIAFITVYRYEHTSTEVWQAGRLVALDTRTDDDGERWQVTGRATADGFVVENNKGARIVAPATVIPTSYWNPATVRQTQLLDSQAGALEPVTLTPSGTERVDLSEGSVAACRWAMRGGIALDLWYARAGHWVQLAFEAKGAKISYAFEGGAERLSALMRGNRGAKVTPVQASAPGQVSGSDPARAEVCPAT